MSTNGYVVALYDFRSKQNYIYRTNSVKEIMGGSEIISSAYRDVIKAYNSQQEKILYEVTGNFSLNNFISSAFRGTVLYDGGGNLQVLYKSNDDFVAFNRFFSYWLIKNTYSLSLVCSSAPFSDKYEQCRSELYRKNRIEKATCAPQLFSNVLPFTQIDRKTSQPVVKKSNNETLSQESVLKLNKYKKIEDNSTFEKEFDKMITEKGEESLLAVIYIDGNGLGKRVQKIINENLSFEDGVNKMRRFSAQIQQAFVSDPYKKIIDTIRNEKNNQIRRIIGGGDEITFVCNARVALKAVVSYFEQLKTNKENTACAGIAIFHSHDPFSVAYSIAEQCCESGKNRIKKLSAVNTEAKNNCYIDFHFCQSGITNDIDILRKTQEKDKNNKPYCICGRDDEHSFNSFISIKNELLKIGRSNIKNLRNLCVKGDAEFDLEVLRLKTVFPKFNLNCDKICKKMIYDIASVFDIWFREED